MNEKHIDEFSKLYSLQAIEIFPSLRSNIGLGNIRARLQQFAGIKFETNSLAPLAIEGLGRRAIVWGICNQNFYRKESDELVKNQFPWAMILTKEKDDMWRILALHWAL